MELCGRGSLLLCLCYSDQILCQVISGRSTHAGLCYDISLFRDCMRGHIESSENPEVKCPYMDDDYHCDEVMQEREIREVCMCFDLY